jgi:hypothetical protein
MKIAIFLGFIGLAVAMPAEVMEKRDPGVFLCTDAGFTGYCVHISTPINVCGMLVRGSSEAHSNIDVTVPLGFDLQNLVTAVGPDQSVGDCRFYL